MVQTKNCVLIFHGLLRRSSDLVLESVSFIGRLVRAILDARNSYYESENIENLLPVFSCIPWNRLSESRRLLLIANVLPMRHIGLVLKLIPGPYKSTATVDAVYRRAGGSALNFAKVFMSMYDSPLRTLYIGHLILFAEIPLSENDHESFMDVFSGPYYRGKDSFYSTFAYLSRSFHDIKVSQDIFELSLLAVRLFGGDAFRSLSERLRSNISIVMASLGSDAILYRRTGYLRHPTLKFAPLYWNARDVVLAAVSSDGMSLNFASDELKNDQVICAAALHENSSAFQYMGKLIQDKFQSDDAFAREIIAKNGSNIKNASDFLRNDTSLCQLAVAQNHLSYFLIPRERQRSVQIIELADLKRRWETEKLSIFERSRVPWRAESTLTRPLF